jgi:hypothetical protein
LLHSLFVFFIMVLVAVAVLSGTAGLSGTVRITQNSEHEHPTIEAEVHGMAPGMPYKPSTQFQPTINNKQQQA